MLCYIKHGLSFLSTCLPLVVK